MSFGKALRNDPAPRWLCAAVIGLGTALSASPASAGIKAASLITLADQEQRLASVSYRLGLANANRCENHNILTGLVVHDLSEYEPSSRAEVARTFLLGTGIGVLAVAPGSPAERAGLLKNDEIVAIGGVDIQTAGAAMPKASSYERVGEFTAQMEEKLATGLVELVVRRQGTTVPVTLAGEYGCGGKAALVPSGQLNAWSDGSYVAITTKLMSFVTDNELAFVVAHEMSHNILGHQAQLGNVSSGLFSNFGRDAARIKETEVEADRFAITLMDGAGCNLSAAAEFLQRSGKKRWPEIATTHPTAGRRIEIVSAAIANLPAHSWPRDQVPYQMAWGTSVPALTWTSSTVLPPPLVKLGDMLAVGYPPASVSIPTLPNWSTPWTIAPLSQIAPIEVRPFASIAPSTAAPETGVALTYTEVPAFAGESLTKRMLVAPIISQQPWQAALTAATMPSQGDPPRAS